VFVTVFKGIIGASLALREYAELIEILKQIGKSICRELRSEKPQEDLGPKQPSLWRFEPVKYDFNPTFAVGIGAGFTPDIVWLLNRLGVSDQHLVPSSLSEYVIMKPFASNPSRDVRQQKLIHTHYIPFLRYVSFRTKKV
jgi:hypothetical protein